MADVKWVRTGGLWERVAPVGLRAWCSLPGPVQPKLEGRVELCIGKVGAGKTTWGAIRAARIARSTGRTLATTGVGWPEPWTTVASWEQLMDLRDAVLLADEIHMLANSQQGLLTGDKLRAVQQFFSLIRKNGVCVVGTSQGWMKPHKQVRELVTTVWLCRPHRIGTLHEARPFPSPTDEPGPTKQEWPTQYFRPATARIPTRAVVWTGHALDPSAFEAHDNVRRLAR